MMVSIMTVRANLNQVPPFVRTAFMTFNDMVQMRIGKIGLANRAHIFPNRFMTFSSHTVYSLLNLAAYMEISLDGE